VTPLRRLRSVSAKLARAVIGLVATVLILILLTLALVQTGWAKNRLRDLIVRQANPYLTATLSIGRLEGSLVRGLQLGDISLSRNGHTLVRIEEVALSYSIRELFQPGVVIRSVRLTHPYVVGAKLPDGRWDLAALVKRIEILKGPASVLYGSQAFTSSINIDNEDFPRSWCSLKDQEGAKCNYKEDSSQGVSFFKDNHQQGTRKLQGRHPMPQVLELRPFSMGMPQSPMQGVQPPRPSHVGVPQAI
jgi:hypothetical protein